MVKRMFGLVLVAAIAVTAGGGTAAPQKRTPAPKRITVQSCDDLAYMCYKTGGDYCLKYSVCKVKYPVEKPEIY